MALFTDAISTIQDLMSRDSSVLSTAETENIDLNAKMSLALQELGIELTTLLQRSNTYDWQFWLQPNPQLSNVVVTPPLKLWHVFQSLALIYQDAYNSQLNDRYNGKWQQYQTLAKQAMGKVIETGVGICSDPIPRAAAPLLASAAGGHTAMTYYASVSFLNSGGEEGQAGDASMLEVADGNVLVVQPAAPPINAVSWNVFVGDIATNLVLQNPAPIPMDQTWMQASDLIGSGRGPGPGQDPNYLRALPRVIQRG